MNKFLACLVLLSGFSFAQIPVTDIAGMIGETRVVALSYIPLEPNVPGRLKSHTGCEFFVSTGAVNDMSFIGGLFGRKTYYLTVNSATCTMGDGEIYTQTFTDKILHIGKPVRVGEELVIPVGVIDMLKNLEETTRAETESN